MPNPVPRDLSAHALAAAEVIRNQNPTTSRKAGANGAAVDLRRSTAAGEESAVRRSRRAPQPSAKVLENNRQVEAVQELELDTASPSATAKRKQRDLEANDGPETSRRRVTFAPADKDDADDTSLLAADASTELSTTAVQIDHVQILKGRVGLMEDSDDDDDGDDDDDDEYLEGNNSSNMPRQKESKMRGERPRGNIKGRALVTDFTNSSSINENFPKYRDKNKYGQRNVPKSILAEYGDKVKKARCVTQWRKMTPNQQKAVCEQIAAKRKKQEAEAKELKANEKRMKQREKEAEKLRRQEATAAKKIANEENRKAKKRESEKKRRDEAKAKAAEVRLLCFALFPLINVHIAHIFHITFLESYRQQTPQSGSCCSFIIQPTTAQ